MSSGRVSHRDTVAGVLRLRSWALAVLTGNDAGEPPRAHARSHRYFWESERCATPLWEKLSGLGAVGDLPDELRQNLLRRVAQEGERIKSVRDQLDTVGEIARSNTWKVAVLKGAVPLAISDASLDLVDLDLLVEPVTASDLASALDRIGYRVTGHSDPRHLRARSRDGGVSIEIHTTLDLSGVPLPRRVWDGLVPIPRLGLFRLGAAEHLWHLLQHVVLDHPERRGLLRELLLLQHAVGECDEAQLGEVREQIHKDDERERFLEVLAGVEAIHHDNPTQPLVDVAARFYAVRSLLDGVPLPHSLEGYVYKWAFGWLFGREARRRLWEEVFWRGLEPSMHHHIKLAERTAPLLGRAYRVSLRTLRAIAAITIAIPAALAASLVASGAMKDYRGTRSDEH